jgi:hypothetical protein
MIRGNREGYTTDLLMMSPPGSGITGSGGSRVIKLNTADTELYELIKIVLGVRSCLILPDVP